LIPRKVDFKSGSKRLAFSVMIRRRISVMAAVKAHLSRSGLEARYKGADEAIARSHFHALWLLASGYEVEEVAELLSFSARWVRSLVKRYNEGGPEALGDQRIHNGTAPSILTPEALLALKERIEAPPADGGVWTGPKIARWLAGFHRLKSVHDQRGWDALVAIGYSIQQPRPRHPEAAGKAERRALKKSLSGRPPRSGSGIRAPRLKSGRWMNTASV
jgi:transposase